MKSSDNAREELIRARFWAKVDKSGECWLWIGARTPFGYGTWRPEGEPGSRRMMAHRLSWEWHFGSIPDGWHVCHHCDTPACVRPDHLFIGTDAHNLADMRRKGRGSPPPHSHGEAHPNHRLTASQVQEIRYRYAHEDTPLWKLAEEYGVVPHTLVFVITRKTWKDLPPVEGEVGRMIERGRPTTRGEGNPDARLTEEQVHEIRLRYARDLTTVPDLAQEFGMGNYAISAILNRQTWKHLPIREGEAMRTRTPAEASALRERLGRSRWQRKT